jgi:hypothetical protein
MKPFDLEAALRGEPVITRDGRPVKIAGYNADAKEHSQILSWADGGTISSWVDGKYHSSGESGNDLFMAPKERKEWIVRVLREIGVNNITLHGPFNNYKTASECADRISIVPGNQISIHEITIIE